MYNGGEVAKIYYSNWIRTGKNGAPDQHYISQTYDERRWAVAAAAAKRVMSMTTPIYALHHIEADDNTPDSLVVDGRKEVDITYYEPWPEGAKGIDPYRSYSEIFNGESPMTANPEFIWARKSNAVQEFSRQAFPYTAGGSNGLGITQKIVDAYLMDNGETISESMEKNRYTEDGYTSLANNFSGYRLNSGVSKMYSNREVRFYASIGFSECIWPCLSAQTADATNLQITYYYNSSNGKTGPTNPLDYPITGYVLKKFVHPQDSWANIVGAKRTDKVYPIIRYAEILLSYAEALNNLQNVYEIRENELPGLPQGESRVIQRDVDEIRNSFNKVRYRAGLPGLTSVHLNDPEEVQRQIERERMVEFLCENQRYFDVRRWGIYEDTENEPIMGMNTDAARSFYYQRVRPNTQRIAQRKVNRKFMFLPIPRVEIKRLHSCDQNPGWE